MVHTIGVALTHARRGPTEGRPSDSSVKTLPCIKRSSHPKSPTQARRILSHSFMTHVIHRSNPERTQSSSELDCHSALGTELTTVSCTGLSRVNRGRTHVPKSLPTLQTTATQRRSLAVGQPSREASPRALLSLLLRSGPCRTAPSRIF